MWNYKRKIAISIFLTSFFSLIFIAIFVFISLYKHYDQEFQSRVLLVSECVRESIIQSDEATNDVLTNAAKYVQRYSFANYVHSAGTLRVELERLARELNVTGIYIADKAGNYFSSGSEVTRIPPDIFENNPGLWEIPDSQNLLTSAIIPSMKPDDSFKFVTFTAQISDKTCLIVLFLNADFVDRTLKNIFEKYDDLVYASLSASDGTILGYFKRDNTGFPTEADDVVLSEGVDSDDGEDILKHLSYIPSSHEMSEQTEKYLKGAGRKQFYTLTMGVTRSSFYQQIWDLGVSLVIIFMLLSFLICIIASVISSSLSEKVQNLTKCIKSITESNDLKLHLPQTKITDEMDYLTQNFNLMTNKILENQNSKIESEKMKALNDISLQVAHDLRSPLSVMEMIVSVSDGIAEDKRVLMRSTMERIGDIADKLLKEYRPEGRSVDHPGQQICPLAGLLDLIVCEKKFLSRCNQSVTIEKEFQPGHIASFVSLDKTNLRQIFSNILDNALEAVSGHESGKILVSLEKDGDMIRIVVSDNGPGICEKHLEILGNRVFSHGKASGHGLGLYHARRVLHEVKGSLNIASAKGSGTSVTISVPSIPPPPWYALEAVLNDSVVIVDDDPGIHSVWKARLSELHEQPKKICFFRTWKEANLWLKEHAEQKITLLTDYELGSSGNNGLQLILENRLEKHSLLVTSHFSDIGLAKQCRLHSVQILPKNLAGLVPVRLDKENQDEWVDTNFSGETPDLILIDDDWIIRESWFWSAREAGLRLMSFECPAEFDRIADNIPKGVPLFVDVCLDGHNLDSSRGGHAYARHLRSSGFRNIYLATSYEKSLFASETWLKGVTGKEFPDHLFSRRSNFPEHENPEI